MKKYSLSNIYQITPEPVAETGAAQFLEDLRCTLESGINLVQFRVKNLPALYQLQLARQALAICREFGALLIFNGPTKMAMEIGCDGVHWDSRTLMANESRPQPWDMLLSAACHDAAQIVRAGKAGVDFITLSPVLATKTHPDAQPMGWDRFRELAGLSQVPVYALGGMSPEMIMLARDAGAYGIAAISSTWCVRS